VAQTRAPRQVTHESCLARTVGRLGYNSASSQKHPELERLMKDEVYNRDVEVPVAKK